MDIDRHLFAIKCSLLEMQVLSFFQAHDSSPREITSIIIEIMVKQINDAEDPQAALDNFVHVLTNRIALGHED